MNIIDAGKQGQVYQPIIFKFTQQHEVNEVEVNSQVAITQKAIDVGKGHLFPKMYGKGKIVILDPLFSNTDKKINKCDPSGDTFDYYESNLWSYFIQEQLGKTMDTYLEQRNEPFSFKTAVQIGITLLEQFKVMHEAGYCQNDLKLENILIGNAPCLPIELQ